MEKTKLETLLEYWNTNRQVGHTSLQEIGPLGYGKKFVWIVLNPRGCVVAKNPNAIIFRVSSISDTNLRGLKCPVGIDHAALFALTQEYRVEVLERIVKVL